MCTVMRLIRNCSWRLHRTHSLDGCFVVVFVLLETRYNEMKATSQYHAIATHAMTVWSPSLVLDVRLYSVLFRLNSSVFFLFRGQLITTNYNVYSRFDLKYDKSNCITVSMRALSYHSDDGPWKLYSCHFFSMNLIRSLELGSTKSRRKSLK